MGMMICQGTTSALPVYNNGAQHALTARGVNEMAETSANKVEKNCGHYMRMSVQ